MIFLRNTYVKARIIKINYVYCGMISKYKHINKVKLKLLLIVFDILPKNQQNIWSVTRVLVIFLLLIVFFVC